MQSWVRVKKGQKDPLGLRGGSPCSELKYFLKFALMKHKHKIYFCTKFQLWYSIPSCLGSALSFYIGIHRGQQTYQN